MALTVRLTPKTERTLDTLARLRRQTRSDVVREAIEQYATTHDDGPEKQQPYRQWEDVLGIVRTVKGPGDATTGELFTKIVRRKARARRPR